ncbi:zinc finger ZZ-type and EF-hand domain-containing protein 1-like isoform X1 [Biomphalaria glabrata]|uniref:Zinc finger ZZ-type and EF-hand domain-containing protein 1-like isoform X1 n=1 Tax=Biomphalaria glabrata TaxID=6526 RepID=A0A9W2ZQC4_BIOGL|nr:zinc finger ZZ-type and EF-hand domain-containing protein 1-like isoform X1 [Biomphalaria glabrata]
MGNSLSDSEDEGKIETPLDADDDLSDGDDASENESKPTYDLCHLFSDNATLRAAATKVKEKIPENVILQHNSSMMQWLEGRLERMEDSVTLAQFCDMLMNQGVERSEAIKAFLQFDCDGSGVADVQTMIEALGQYSSRSALGELGKSIRILQSCSLTPGFVDVYAGSTHPVEKHGARILKYLLRNRAESSSLPFVYLNSFNNVFTMRASVLKHMFNTSKEEVKDFEVDNDVNELEKKTIYNCYSTIEVSSNPSEAHLLRNTSTFWQSDGAARSHWIRLHIKNNIILKHLSIGVVSTDQSYMPELVTVSVGQSSSRLREIKELKIENHVSGRVLLLKNMKAHYAYVQINIKRCHGDGCDTRIHGVKAVGFKIVREQGVTSVMDASALWYLQILTSTVSFSLPQAPGLRPHLLNHTRRALESMPPLMLSVSSTEKPSFLSRSVLQEIESFAEHLASNDGQEEITNEGLQVILAFNLARGSISGLIKFLNKIVEMANLRLACAELLAKSINARNNSLEKLGLHVPVTFLASDGGPGMSNVGPESVIEPPTSSNTNRSLSTSVNRIYFTDEGKTKCTMLFKSEENVQLTKIRIQVSSGIKGPKHGLIFVYNPESIPELNSKSSPTEHIDYFSKYDFWHEKEFEFSISFRNSGLGGNPDNPVSYFHLDNDCDEIDVPVQWNAVGKFILVKFLEPRHESATRLGISTIKFFGLTKSLVIDYTDQKPLAIPDPSKKQSCDLPEIVSIVSTFVTDIAVEQVKKKGRVAKPQFEFLDLSDLDVTELWLVHLACEKRMKEETGTARVVDQWKRSSLSILQLIHGLIPVLATSKGTSEASRDTLFQWLCGMVNTEAAVKDEPGNLYRSNKLKLIKQIIIDGAPLFFPEKSKKRLELFRHLKTVSDQSSMPSMSLVFQSLCQFFSSVDPKGLLELPSNSCEDFSTTGTLDMMKSLLVVACQDIEDTVDSSAPKKPFKQSAADTLNKESSAVVVEEEQCARSDDTGQNCADEKLVETVKEKDLVEDAATATPHSEAPVGSAADAEDPASDKSHQMTYLIKLTASLQTSLVMWCWQQLETTNGVENESLVKMINSIVFNYITDVAEKADKFLSICKNLPADELKSKVAAEEPAFLCIIVRQLLLLLTMLVNKLNTDTKVNIMLNLKKMAVTISEVAKVNPHLFSDITSDCWTEVDTEETVLRTWEVESPHDYLNHSNIVQMFHCPGASKLVIEFDSRCETERRYDYLEFTDAKGLKLRFDQKVGTLKWPKKVTFSGPYVGFLFHSDSSNTEWGYKFTVTAVGTPDIQSSWMSDLQLSLIKVLGQLAGSTLSSNPTLTQNATLGLDNSSDQILRSDLWTSLFRGGYTVGKLQRSLSGKLATEKEGRVHLFLLEVVAVTEMKPDVDNHVENTELKQQAARFLAKCKDANKSKMQVVVGGQKVDVAISSLFAALVWHCQQLREDVEKFLKSGEITEGLAQAYTTAESVRITLAHERQKWNNAENKVDGTDPAELFATKALYLLKFAGLTKVQLRNELRSKSFKQMALKKAGNKRPVVRNEVLEKFPSFVLVMEFTQDQAWTAESVHQMLQERTKFAAAISEVYLFAAEMIRIMSYNDPFKIPIVLFFREMFAYQDKFTKHYADGLDGCGLEQEAKVRTTYYTLVNRFVDAFKKADSQPQDSKVMPAYDFLQCILLHLLDMEWQPYDLSFVSELHLPQLYLHIAKATVKMRDYISTDLKVEEEVAEYERSMKWYNEIKQMEEINSWFKHKENIKDDKKAVKMFVARFSDVLDVEISCDGCSVTLPGRRYRCLQCMDMDLCTSCFSGGVEPEEHRDSHEIVHLVYKCNHCQAFIVGTRIHCNECDDFDLCLGCHLKHKFPSGHSDAHDVTKVPMVKVMTSQSSNSSLKAYIHQHVWLLYTSLTLSLSDLAYGTDTGTPYIDSDYIRIAGHLQRECIELATSCLDHVTGEGDETLKDVPTEKRLELTFAIHSQERIMGLLGAVAPHFEKKAPTVEMGFNFCTEDFLIHLLQVSRGDRGHELNTQHLALRLMGRLLASSETNRERTMSLLQMADRSTSRLMGEETKSMGGIDGLQTISYLFSIGAKAFEKSGLEWSCSVARMLEMLFSTPEWKPAVQEHVSLCVQTLKDNLTDSSIFPMFVIAGFPELLTTGTLVDYNYTSLDNQSGVVLKHFPDKYQTLLVDLKTRKRHTVKDEHVTCCSEVKDVLEPESISKFVSFVVNTVNKIKLNEEVPVKALWILSLALKVLNKCFKGDKMEFVGKKVFTAGFIQSLVYLACNGTGLNQNWLLKDLEVLALICYTHDGSSIKKNRLNSLKKKTPEDHMEGGHLTAATDKDNTYENCGKVIGDKDIEDAALLISGTSSSSSDDEMDSLSESTSIEEEDSDWNMKIANKSDEEDEPPEQAEEKPKASELENGWGSLAVDQATKDLLNAIHTELDIPIPVLRALYNMNEGRPEGIAKALLENFGDPDVASSGLLLKLRSSLNANSEKKDTVSSEDTAIDTGITNHPGVGQAHKIPESAVSESGDNPQNLFKQQDTLAGEIGERIRGKSASLLKKELSKRGRSGLSDNFPKINMAMCVLYARHTLTGLLAFWPDSGPVINSTLLGCKDVKQIPCVLDLLYKIDTRNYFSKVVDKVIHMCDAASLVPIAFTAAQFMEEVTLSAVTRESAHNYTDKDKKKSHVQLHGASYLTVTFDEKCATAEDDSLIFSTRKEMDKDVHSFSGSNRAKWTSFHIPGDTFYYKFCIEDYDPDMANFWGYKFTVTPGTRDSFETGHAILEAVLSSSLARCLPLDQLWSSLVFVACKQPGAQRLKAISLMLKIVALQSVSVSGESKTGPDIDLSLLTPLWELYRKMSRDDKEPLIQPAVVRALTDLFLHTENLASEWNMTESYLVSLMDSSDICTSLIHGLTNIAAISLEIGYNSGAPELIKELAQKLSCASPKKMSF